MEGSRNSETSNTGRSSLENKAHRAMRFVRFQECPHAWIDQECIRQDDATDIERHLKVMHRVYEENERTVLSLATPIPGQYSLESSHR